MALLITADNRMSEWLEADGLGGFASGTVCGVRTRRYHALLLAAARPPTNRMVLVNGLDAELELPSGRFALSTQRYAPGVNAPDGVDRLTAFDPDPWPRWTYALPGGQIEHELFVPRDRSAVVLRWRWLADTFAPIRLHVRPFFSGRDFHLNHHENPAFGFVPREMDGCQYWHLYDGVPEVTARSNGAYYHEPNWYRDFLYDEEAARGLDATEDLAAPGRYEFDLAAGPAILILSTGSLDLPLTPTSPPAVEIADTLARLEIKRRADFGTPHLRAADAYIVKRGEGCTIIAGYPWFGDWGRDSFISMRGLCLAGGRLEDARKILVEWAGVLSQGMLPNRIPDHGEAPEYNSVDASLWYVVVVHEFLDAVRHDPALSAQRDLLLGTVEAILEGYLRGTNYGIRGTDDGLLACGVPGVQLTWMDAKVGDRVITPRIGKPVEIQALWLNALALAGRSDPKWQTRFEQGRTAFQRRFWNESRGCLYDVIDADHEPGKLDASLRPNQIFTVGGLPIPLVDEESAARIVHVVQDQLWTPMGLRSLAPGEPGYAPHYGGSPSQRDGAYHQGTVWPWLAGPFVEAWARVHGGSPEIWRQARDQFLTPRLLQLDLAGLHHVPEIADAELPNTARGCPFQAWSLGELLRVTR
ncbi:MAG TPA: amylo-alpha-1,6-glucosidase [Candidatus Methylacidiphilales bacterium]|nr:amylo-alpha-1,6-glucosidase [Candidatus Methylacidiphilales bacterium]